MQHGRARPRTTVSDRWVVYRRAAQSWVGMFGASMLTRR